MIMYVYIYIHIIIVFLSSFFFFLKSYEIQPPTFQYGGHNSDFILGELNRQTHRVLSV